MAETTVGLPNTCCQCGADPGPAWYAANDDAALAGQGTCAACAGVEDGVRPNSGDGDGPRTVRPGRRGRDRAAA